MTAAKGELMQQIERLVASASNVDARREGVERELAAAQHAEETLRTRAQ